MEKIWSKLKLQNVSQSFLLTATSSYKYIQIHVDVSLERDVLLELANTCSCILHFYS